jgi:hypothetical protein
VSFCDVTQTLNLYDKLIRTRYDKTAFRPLLISRLRFISRQKPAAQGFVNAFLLLPTTYQSFWKNNPVH